MGRPSFFSGLEMKRAEMGVASKTAAFAAVTATLVLGACASQGEYATRDALVSPVNCINQTFEVYFEEGQARLTSVAREAISMTATRLQGCHIDSVSVTGLASATGSATANQNLSEQRAVAVREALSATGWPAPLIDVSAVGAEGARTGNVNEPLRRRTEVVVAASPPRR